MPAKESNQRTYLPQGLPKPAVDPDRLDAEFWEGLKRHELLVQQCKRCGTLQLEPEVLCYKCRSFDRGWKKVAPRGRIYSWERMWYAAHPALKDSLPYVVVLVELEEDPSVRVIGNLLGDPHQEVKIGTAVEGVFEDHPDEDFTLLQWRRI